MSYGVMGGFMQPQGGSVPAQLAGTLRTTFLSGHLQGSLGDMGGAISSSLNARLLQSY